ncbi:MAG: META domain-containing protein [Halodesulfovibrio sp.]
MKRLPLVVPFILLLLCAILLPVTGAHAKSPARQTSAKAIMGTTWMWSSTTTPMETIEAEVPARYTIALEDGRVSARFDCNRGGGTYKLSDGKLSFGMMMATMMMCAPDSQDSVFMRDLQFVTTFYVEDGVLYLGLDDDAGTMEFRPAP